MGEGIELRSFKKDTDKRFMAYFDIMGFKDYVYRHSHDELNERMSKVSTVVRGVEELEWIVEKLEKTDPQKERLGFLANYVRPVIFSDTILIVSEFGTIGDALKILNTASMVLNNLLLYNIPIKGSLSYGDISADFEKSLYYGKPLIDAYNLAEEVNYYGAVLHNSFEKFIIDNKLEIEKKHSFFYDFICRNKINMKYGKSTYWRLKLRHESGEHESIFDELLVKPKVKPEKLLADKFNDFYGEVSGSARKYVDNSVEMYGVKFENEKK